MLLILTEHQPNLKIRISSENARLFYGEKRTDENGNFTFNGLNKGEYKIHFIFALV